MIRAKSDKGNVELEAYGNSYNLIADFAAIGISIGKSLLKGDIPQQDIEELFKSATKVIIKGIGGRFDAQ